jgi:hypothetical protein
MTKFLPSCILEENAFSVAQRFLPYLAWIVLSDYSLKSAALSVKDKPLSADRAFVDLTARTSFHLARPSVVTWQYKRWVNDEDSDAPFMPCVPHFKVQEFKVE